MYKICKWYQSGKYAINVNIIMRVGFLCKNTWKLINNEKYIIINLELWN